MTIEAIHNNKSNALSNLIVSVGMIVAMIGLPPVPRLFPEEKGSNADVSYEVCEESCG